jgi:TetR/AcrR family transcriptional regulator
METGFEVFCELGFNGATTRLISQRSGVNESLIIRYFESKQGLFLAILLDMIRRDHTEDTHYKAGQTVAEEITHFLQFQFERGLKHRDFMRLCISRLAIDAEIRQKVDQFVRGDCESEQSVLEKRLLQFQEKGKICKDLNIKDIAHVINLQVLGNKFLILAMPEVDPEETIESIRIFAAAFGKSLSI